MKKYFFTLFVFILIIGATAVNLVPVKKDKKPIFVERLCVAEEIAEIENIEEGQSSFNEADDFEMEETCICVSGKHVSSVKPDRAKICGVIEILDTDMAMSKETNFASYEKVVSALKAQGVNEEDVFLEYFCSSPSYDYSNGRTFQGYLTSTTFTVNVEDIANLNGYIDTMIENGTTGICNIRYELSTMEEEYSNALSSALEKAKAKATKLSGGDVKLVKIKEEMLFSSNELCRAYVEGLSDSLIGEIKIEARIFAEFETI